jgi:mono/diheme cytochrome c family protein
MLLPTRFSQAKWLLVCLGLALLGLFWPRPGAYGESLRQTAADGEVIFSQKCTACHSIGGGDRVGPDLQGVTQRRDLAWLTQMIAAPDQLIASRDPIVMPLLAQFNNLPMPNMGLTPTEVESVIAYLENPGGGASQAQPTPPPVPSGDAAAGRQYFTGARPLANGGPNCLECHHTADLTGLGGGTLGPDLTQVAQRLGDAGLMGALQTLPFPTMQGVFANHMLTPTEQADLHAYFLSIQALSPRPANPLLWLWGAGIGGALLLFALLGRYWPRQRRSISDRLRDRA